MGVVVTVLVVFTAAARTRFMYITILTRASIVVHPPLVVVACTAKSMCAGAEGVTASIAAPVPSEADVSMAQIMFTQDSRG